MRRKKIMRIVICIITIFYLSNCSGQNSIYEFTRINFIYKSPDVIKDTQTYTYSISLFISYYDKYRLYELPYHDIKEVNNVLIYDSIKWDYYVHNVNDKYGFFLKNLNDSFLIKYKNDSLLLRSYNGGKRYNGDVLFKLKILKSNKINSDNQRLIFRYIVKDKMYDSVYLYYNENLKNIDFTLSGYRDSIANSKLYKAQYFIKKGKIATYIPNDFYENIFEIKLAPAANKKDLINLIERYKKAEADHLLK
jgi:hypothetical protein